MTNDTQTISDGITTPQIDEAVAANRAILQERFPDLDISVGGPVDSVLVDGASVITARNTADVNRAYLFQQLRAIAQGLVEVPNDDVDRLVSNYYLTRREATPASGPVSFIVRNRAQYTLQAGYTLRVGGQSYRVPRTVTVYPDDTANVDFTAPQNVRLEQVYDAETGFDYRFAVTVQSVEARPEAVLVAGQRLTPTQAFDGLGYVVATTNFQGGFAAEDNEALARRALDGLVARNAASRDGIRACVRDVIPLGDSSAIGANDPLMSRDRNNVFGISSGGRVDVYVKSGAVASAGYLDITATVTDPGTRTVRITLSREQSAGVYRVTVWPRYTSTPPTLVSGAITVEDELHEPWVDPDDLAFNPQTPDEIDRAFSARQIITIDITDDRETATDFVVPMSAVGDDVSEYYQVQVEYQAGVLEADAQLTGTLRPPGTDILVKAAAPCFISVGVIAERPVEYNGPDEDSLSASLASAINQLPIGTRFIDGLAIASLLREIEPSLTMASVSLSGLIYGQDGSDIALAPSGTRLSLPTHVLAKVSAANTYFTTTAAQTAVTLV